ncbi:MAG: hypothetical protein NUV77_21065 [Thermoguttaceae bacterium]|jgi:hypothetical protein|nr:hypothetical protein [Thermoguttaceae bacterium]
MTWSFLFAAEGMVHTRFEWGRIHALSEWMTPAAAWTLVFTAALGILLWVVLVYLRDVAELHPLSATLLVALRVTALLGLLVLFLQPQWRTQREVVHRSRAVVLVDSSLSMGLTDRTSTPAARPGNRAQQAAAALNEHGFLRQLRKTHDVFVFRFDESLTPITSLDKQPREDGGSAFEGRSERALDAGAGGGENDKPGSLADTSDAPVAPPTADPDVPKKDDIDWETHLKPTGRETRLGQALRQVIAEQRNAPLSGIVVFSDGGQNAGPPPETAVELAREAKIPVYTVGLGSPERPVNVRVYEVEAPERAHPGDPYSVTGLIQAQGLAGQAVTVQLVVTTPGKEGEQLAESRQVILARDGDVVPVKFQVTPTETGRRQLSVRVLAPPGDHNPDDNRGEADIDIVDRKTKVLLFAGGPSREYQFLRTLLHRDPSATVDVVLQTAEGNISQEADRILDEFPKTREELFAYDCVVAFDPQWHTPPGARTRGLSPAQVDLLETWVAEQGGGLILVAGPVHSGQALGGWVQDPEMAKIRALYPVDFPRNFTVLERNTYVAKEPWSLQFTREGREAEFLWLADTAAENERAWAAFAGVYGYQPVRGPKAGATVYAHFSDPRAVQGDQPPIYFAGQFYGSGRVFYMGSGEMWRLRRHDDAYFDRFYTRLIRHVSQGRLLRQSSRGSLMVDKDRYLLGATAEIRAQLTGAQLQPLTAPSVPVEVVQPDGKVQTITLRPDASRAGMYAGQLTLLQEGAYRLELLVPESDNERLTRRLQVRLPDLERETPQRNDQLLTRIAQGTGARYYPQIETAVAADSSESLASQLRDCTKTSILTDARNEVWEETWRRWVMFALCGILCMEWLLRRLAKLA